MGLVIILFKTTAWPQVSVTNYATAPAQDGYVREDGFVDTIAATARIGDDAGNLEMQGFIGINLGSIPTNVVITSATLYFSVNSINGTPNNPYWLSLVDFGNSIDAGDFGSPALGGFADFANFNPSIGWDFISVTATAQYSLDNPKAWSLDGSSRWFQVRMRANIPTDGDNGTDFVMIDTFESANAPYLSITYVPNCSAPAITGFSPSAGCPGDILTITGTGFGIITNVVRIGGSSGTNVIGTSWTTNEIHVIIPAGVNGQVYVLNVCGSTNTTTSNFFAP